MERGVMTYKQPISTAGDYGVVQSGSGLSVTDGVISVVPVALLDQAYFFSTQTQTNPVANAVNIITFDNSAINVGITLVGGSQITVSKDANYNFQFVIQIDKTDAGTDLADLWLIRNGTAYPNTNSQVSVEGTVGVLVASWNFTVALNAGDNIQVAWQSTDVNMRLLTTPAQVGPIRPATPSVRCTIIQL
jgi:hypothetical protein